MGGLQTSVFETVLCLQISADLISVWRQRLEEDLAGGEKTVRKRLIKFGMYSPGTGSCDLTDLRGNASKEQIFSGGSRIYHSRYRMSKKNSISEFLPCSVDHACS